MRVFNIVRFRVKPGRDHEFLAAHKAAEAVWPGLEHAVIVKTGDSAYCLIGEWSDEEAMVKARPAMIATLDTFRGALEETATGVTDAVSGTVVLTLR